MHVHSNVVPRQIVSLNRCCVLVKYRIRHHPVELAHELRERSGPGPSGVFWVGIQATIESPEKADCFGSVHVSVTFKRGVKWKKVPPFPFDGPNESSAESVVQSESPNTLTLFGSNENTVSRNSAEFDGVGQGGKTTNLSHRPGTHQ